MHKSHAATSGIPIPGLSPLSRQAQNTTTIFVEATRVPLYQHIKRVAARAGRYELFEHGWLDYLLLAMPPEDADFSLSTLQITFGDYFAVTAIADISARA